MKNAREKMKTDNDHKQKAEQTPAEEIELLVEIPKGDAQEEPQQEESLKEELKAKEQKALNKLKALKENVKEEDSTPVGTLTLKKILGGDLLGAAMVRKQVWLFVLIAFFVIVYVAFRYQCQQDIIKIAEKESELKDAKYKALSSQSTLTERCRESQVLEALKQQHDSALKISEQPPYIIKIEK